MDSDALFINNALKLPFSPEDLLCAKARFVRSISAPDETRERDFLFDFNPDIRVISCVAKMALLSDDEHPILQVGVCSSDPKGSPPKMPIAACLCFDLTDVLVPMGTIETSAFTIFYYCPDCVEQRLTLGRRPNLHLLN